MGKRISIPCPARTVAVLDRLTKPGNCSRFIGCAVLCCVETQGKRNLRERLAAIADAERGLEIAARRS